MKKIQRIIATDATRQLISELEKRHGPLMFRQSGGCCDGSQPMCYKAGDFKVGSSDVKLGEVCGYPFWMAKDSLSTGNILS